MKKSIMKKSIGIFVSVLFVALVLSGCTKVLPYNAVCYGDTVANRSYLRDDFYTSNLTRGASLSPEDGYAGDEYPQEVTVVVDSEEKFNVVFKEFPEKVDFSKNVILMYGSTASSGSTFQINDVRLDGGVLKVDVKENDSPKSAPNTTVPMTKWIFVLMEKAEFETVSFE